MILHLGNDFFVETKQVVVILDYEEAVRNDDTSLFLKGVRKTQIAPEQPKSIVITDEQGERKAYLSPISARTLWRRSKNFSPED